MEKKLKVSLGAKADHTVAGELLMEVREIISTQEMDFSQRIEALKLGISTLDKRIQLRAEQRKNALAQIEIDEHNARFLTSLKINSLELSDIE